MQLQNLLEIINHCIVKYGRASGSVKLLAVSKKKTVEQIQQILKENHFDFGESYLQEALQKIATIDSPSICWHFIGPIQSNKTDKIAQHFDWVHSIDRLKIAQRLNNQRPESFTPLNVCIQVNISQETSKSGVAKNEVLELASNIVKLPHLKLRGLMAMPAASNDFDRQRLAFRELRQVFADLNRKGFELDTLSMGTSNDLEAAIAEGATILRIGSAIFGERK